MPTPTIPERNLKAPLEVLQDWRQEATSFQGLIYETTTSYIAIAVQNDREWQAMIRASALLTDCGYSAKEVKQLNDSGVARTGQHDQ